MRGGLRQGSGRKAKAPTKTISFRVPLDFASLIKSDVELFIKNKLETNYYEEMSIKDVIQNQYFLKTKGVKIL